MDSISLGTLLKLSVSERLLLVEDLWDSIAEVPQSLVLTTEQCEELDARLAAYHADSQQGAPWDVVKQRITQGI